MLNNLNIPDPLLTPATVGKLPYLTQMQHNLLAGGKSVIQTNKIT